MVPHVARLVRASQARLVGWQRLLRTQFRRGAWLPRAGELGLALILGSCLLVACTRPSTHATSASATSPPPSAAAPAQPTAPPPAQPTATSQAAPGCGVYCEQAGGSAGNGPPDGYPCAATGCERCPSQGCVSLISSAAVAVDGVVTVELRCNLLTACRGAFLLCFQDAFCHGTMGVSGGRLAGSDFVVPAGATSAVRVALTELGKQIAPQPGGYSAAVMVDLADYGYVFDTTGASQGTFVLSSTDPPVFPAGAIQGCGQSVFVGPDTSCQFALNVRQDYWANVEAYIGKSATVSAVSPVTSKTYVMRCTTGPPIVCRGGTNALVEFYQ